MAKRLTNEQKARICELRSKGLQYDEIAESIGCGKSTVCRIINPVVAERNRVYSFERYHSDPGRFKALSVDWQSRNKDYLAEYRRQRYSENVEQFRAYSRQYNEGHRAERAEYRRAHNTENREAHNAYSRSYRFAHPEAKRASESRRRTRSLSRMDKFDIELSRTYRVAIASDPCFYCGAPGEQDDHYMPIAKGGTDHWWNIVRACWACNSFKRAKLPETFMASLSLAA